MKILLSLLILVSLISCNDQEQLCGTVVYRDRAESKYGDVYYTITYQHSKGYTTHYVEPQVYAKFLVGSTICFEETTEASKKAFDYTMYGFITLIVVAFLAVFGSIAYSISKT